MEQPIVIIGSPRSGTSLTAAVFAAHGVWTGVDRAPDQHNPFGYYENLMLSTYRMSMGHDGGMDPNTVLRLMELDGYKGGPWLLKHTPVTWRAWSSFQPQWVLVFRDVEDILQSRYRTWFWPNLTEVEHKVLIDTDHATMSSIKRHIGGTEIWPHEFCSGDDHSMKDAIEASGLVYDAEKARSCLHPEVWHSKVAV